MLTAAIAIAAVILIVILLCLFGRGGGNLVTDFLADSVAASSGGDSSSLPEADGSQLSPRASSAGSESDCFDSSTDALEVSASSSASTEIPASGDEAVPSQPSSAPSGNAVQSVSGLGSSSPDTEINVGD